MSGERCLKQAVILLKTDKDQQWQESLRKAMPELEIRCWPQVGRADEIDYALLWNPPESLFDQLSALKVIFSVGAGVDGIIKVANRPVNVPLVRLSDQELVSAMVQYVVYSVLRLHRNMADYDYLQQQNEWGFYRQVPASQCHVGVMGLGQLGLACVNALKALGYSVHGYSRSDKDIEDVDTFSEAELNQFLQRTQILVCLLPLTDSTKRILNKTTFSHLPRGASIINVGRGGHLCEADLLQALAEKQIDRAILDVFEDEPLPQSHPFWQHPRITVTPHIASQTMPESAVQHVVDGIKKHQAGDGLDFLYDAGRGY